MRTYRLFKEELKTEAYVNIIMPKHHRSALAKFRAGVAPLRIETGRYERTIVPINQRTCFNCLNNIEDEFHVIMKCPIYNELRQELLSQVDENLIPADMNENDVFILLMSHENVVKLTVRFLFNVLKHRTNTISK